MEDIRQVIGRNAVRLRRAAGLTQEALAVRAGVSQQYLSGFERGQRNPSVLTLAQIAEALGAPVLELLRDENTE